MGFGKRLADTAYEWKFRIVLVQSDGIVGNECEFELGSFNLYWTGLRESWWHREADV